MENGTQFQEEVQVEQKSSLHTVTPFSKYLAMGLFVLLPFVGGYVGYMFAPEKVVEVEKIVIENVPVDTGQIQEEEKVSYVLELEYNMPIDDISNGESSVLLVGGETTLEIYSQQVANDDSCWQPEGSIPTSLAEHMYTVAQINDEFVSIVVCKFTGNGTIIALFKNGDAHKVVQVPVESCEDLAACEPYGEPEIIWRQ